LQITLGHEDSYLLFEYSSFNIALHEWHSMVGATDYRMLTSVDVCLGMLGATDYSYGTYAGVVITGL
jgi:hypothetical protein